MLNSNSKDTQSGRESSQVRGDRDQVGRAGQQAQARAPKQPAEAQATVPQLSSKLSSDMEKLSRLEQNLDKLKAACSKKPEQIKYEEELPPVKYPEATPGEECFKDLDNAVEYTPGEEPYQPFPLKKVRFEEGGKPGE